MIHLDTHVVVWLFAGDRERLRPAWEVLEAEDLVISPLVELELQTLFEVRRTTVPGAEVVADLVQRVGLQVSSAPLARVVGLALGASWTRDPFDRLIAASAVADGAPLLTADGTILAHVPTAFWGSAPPRTGG